jgi:glycosyltransferase involved in cell wall biosynthesis
MVNGDDRRPGVSVVLIFLNDERFVDEAIQSVLRQTTSDWELLLVDDGSTDGSTAVARRYAAADIGRIRYLEHAGHVNRGKSSSRNLGLCHARGEYLICLDSDDILLPHALEVFTGLLAGHPAAAMVYGPLQYWYSWMTPPYRRGVDFQQPLGVAADALIEPPDVLRAFLQRRAAVPSGMLVRASVAREVGGYEEAFRWMYDDQVFCAKVCLAWPVLTSSTCVYRYRQHAASSSAVADRSGEYELGRLAFLEWLAAYLLSNGHTDPELWRAVRAELWWTRHPRLGRLRKATRRARRRLASVTRALTSLRGTRRPSGHAGENSGNVGQMTRSRAWLQANTPESKDGVAPEKP